MKSFKGLVAEHAKYITEHMPWDLEENLVGNEPPLILDIREAEEFKTMRIQNSMNIPRGILESACDYNYSETIPELVKAGDKEIILVCESGNQSVMVAFTMQLMGYTNVAYLKITGLKGWNDYEQPLVGINNQKVNAGELKIF